MKRFVRTEGERWAMETGAESTDATPDIRHEQAEPVEGTLNDFDRDPFSDYTGERRDALRAELPWRQGASDFYALRFADHKDPQDFQHLAQREQASLEAVAAQLHTEPLLRNYSFQKKYNEGETSDVQRKEVESRLENVVEATTREYKNVDSWIPSYLAKTSNGKDRPLNEEARGRIGGFGLSALESNDFKNARLAFDAGVLLEDLRIREAIEKKRRILERDFTTRTHGDSTQTISFLKQFESLFGEAAPKQQAA